MPIPAGAAGSPFALPAELATWLGDPDLDATAATMFLAAATATVVSETGQDFHYVAGDVVTLIGDDDRWLLLPQRPVVAVSAVSVDGTAQTAASWTLAGSRLWRHCGWGSAYGGLSVANGTWSGGCAPTAVTVTYDHGYVTIPADVKAATLAVAADMASNPAGLLSESIDDYTWRRSDTAAGAAAGLLLATVVKRYGASGARSVRLSS